MSIKSIRLWSVIGLAIAGVHLSASAGTNRISSVGFEGFNTDAKTNLVVGTGITDDGTTSSGSDTYWYADTNSLNESKVVDTGAQIAYPSAVGQPDAFDGTESRRYLKVSTLAPLSRTIKPIQNLTAPTTWQSQDVATDGTYLDMLVQFQTADSMPTPTNTEKLLVWMDSAKSNLNIVANYLGYENSAYTYTVTNYTTSTELVPEHWYRLTVKALANLSGSDTYFPGFAVYLDGELQQSSEATMSDAAKTQLGTVVDFVTNKAAFVTLNGAGVATAPALQAVTFLGSGALDSFVVTESAPAFLGITGADFVLNTSSANGVKVPSTWIAGMLGLPVSPANAAAIDRAMDTKQANGYTGWEGYALGLEPTNATSCVLCEAKQDASADKFTFVAKNVNVPADLDTTKVTVQYVLKGSTDLATWDDVARNTANSLEVAAANVGNHVYYRVVAEIVTK